jgi:hypothetical protein
LSCDIAGQVSRLVNEHTRHDSHVPLYWKIIVRELRELAWNVGRRGGGG